jgi:hypothetical protein
VDTAETDVKAGGFPPSVFAAAAIAAIPATWPWRPGAGDVSRHRPGRRDGTPAGSAERGREDRVARRHGDDEAADADRVAALGEAISQGIVGTKWPNRQAALGYGDIANKKTPARGRRRSDVAKRATRSRRRLRGSVTLPDLSA